MFVSLAAEDSAEDASACEGADLCTVGRADTVAPSAAIVHDVRRGGFDATADPSTGGGLKTGRIAAVASVTSVVRKVSSGKVQVVFRAKRGCHGRPADAESAGTAAAAALGGRRATADAESAAAATVNRGESDEDEASAINTVDSDEAMATGNTAGITATTVVVSTVRSGISHVCAASQASSRPAAQAATMGEAGGGGKDCVGNLAFANGTTTVGAGEVVATSVTAAEAVTGTRRH